MMKIKNTFLLSTLMLVYALSGLSVFAQQPEQPISPVQVAEVKKTMFAPTVNIVGSIYSRHNVKLTAGVNGRLDFVVEPGTYLKKDQEVARIDQLPLMLQQAEQNAQIKRANINQTYLERELQRLKELRETNSASAFQFDQTQSQYELAKADLEIARLKLKQIEDQLSRTVVRAPFEGVVTERLREAGGEVNRSEILVHMLDTKNLEGRVFVPVKYLPYIRHVDTINVQTDSHQVEADIKAIIPAADTRSQSFELRVSLPVSEDGFWTAGQLIKASLPIQKPQESLTVHRDALILRREGTYVVVIDKENKAYRKLVTVGEGHEDWVSVKANNLNQGDRVATRGAERLKDGQIVEIAKPHA